MCISFFFSNIVEYVHCSNTNELHIFLHQLSLFCVEMVNTYNTIAIDLSPWVELVVGACSSICIRATMPKVSRSNSV